MISLFLLMPERLSQIFWHCTRAGGENIWGEVGKLQWGKVGIALGDQVMPRTLRGLIRQRLADS